jgi:hypothetical protein
MDWPYRRLCAVLVVVSALVIGNGCATMIRGTEEVLSITSEPSGALAEVSDGQKGTTPCQVKLKRNQSVLIKYSKEGYESETLSVFPTLAGSGVILGGVIDYGTGAVYSLAPNPAHVMLKPKVASALQSSSSGPNEEPKKSLAERLDELDQLKRDGKITPKEYKDMRQRILDGN